MISHLTDEAQWALAVGARLRLLQASFADDDPGSRRGYLAEELEREIREIPLSRRRGYLEALSEQFPSGFEDDETESPEPEVAVEAPAIGETPESLVSQLVEMAAQLDDQQRFELSQRLQAAGFALAVEVSSGGSNDAEEIPPELQKKLSLDPDQMLDRKRAIRLVAVLIDLVVTMDQVAWQVWKNLAPNSRVRRATGTAGDLRKLAGPFLVGDPEVSLTQLTQLLDKTRQLTAGLLAAVGTTGETFARQYLTRFSPHAIQEAADAEPGFFIGPEQKCWRKYMQLFNETSGVIIESEIANAIVNYTEELILGTRSQTESSAG